MLINNAATGGTGGAIYAYGASTLRVNGSLCAQGNSGTAGFGQAVAGFAYLEDSTKLFFLAPAAANLANNAPVDIAVVVSARVYSEGVNGNWVPGQKYNITGAIIANCSEAFVAGTATTCNSCSAQWPWIPTLCTCKVCLLLYAGGICQGR